MHILYIKYRVYRHPPIMFKVEFIMSNQSDHDSDTKSILNDVSRRHFIQASSALVTLPFLASHSFATTTDNAIPVKPITTEADERCFNLQ